MGILLVAWMMHREGIALTLMYIVDVLEKEGFGKRTGKKRQSGYVVYPEFSFREEVLRDCTNENYEQYLTWQEALGEDEEYLTVSCRSLL